MKLDANGNRITRSAQIITDVSTCVRLGLQFGGAENPFYQTESYKSSELSDLDSIDFFRSQDPLTYKSFDPVYIRNIKDAEDVLATSKQTADSLTSKVE